MNKLLKGFLLGVVASFLVAGSAMAEPLTLYDITSFDGTQNYLDTGVQAVNLTDTDGTADDVTAFLFFEFAGFAPNNRLGIYDYTVNSDGSVVKGNELEIFAGAASPLASVTLSWDLSTNTVTNSISGVTAVIGSTFGFYLKNDVDVEGGFEWFSHTSLNADGKDHMMLFDTSDNTVSALLGSDVVLAWEDLSLGDKDYNDMVVGISDIAPAPVPEPATMLLLGMGLLGLAGITRKRTKA